MINIIVPIVESLEKYVEFLERINTKDIKIFVGIRENLINNFKISSKQIEIHKFASNSNLEEILNSMHSCKMQKGRILIVRRPLSNAEFEKLTNSTKDISTLKAKHNKFVMAIKNFAKKIVKRFFSFTFFEDISAICYNENLFELISVCTNLSMTSRLNRYIGISIEEFETETKQVKKQYSRWKNALLFMLSCLLFMGSVAGGVLICIFTPLRVFTIIAVVFWIVLALFLWFIALLNFIRTIVVGNLRYGRVSEII